jgi:Domain of unknown function (DUF4123)/Inner membrane component of T3SS, cytoplasmic domain
VRAIVLIEWGTRRWRRAMIEPGGRLRVGRFERADLVVPNDEALSGLHAELTWDGARGALRDLGSAGGTFLNGERVTEGELGHGDWFRAGNTVFSFYVEGDVPPWEPAPEAPLVLPERRAEALTALRAEGAPLYAVLDAARDSRITTLLRASAEESQSLYEGAEGEELEDVAPYLVSLPRDSWLLDRLVKEGWGQGWGIYLLSRRPFQEVRRHLRRLLIAQVKETGELLYFRFYDPVTVRDLSPTFNPRQHYLFFGPSEALVMEGEGGRVVRLEPRA